MKPPRLETRRRRELDDELVRRGRAWLPEWRPRNVETDLAGALFAIAARVGSEVTQRLDRVPEKAFRGFLDWLGVRGQARRAARLPVVFAMAAGSEPVLARAGVQLQAILDDAPEPVFFETEKDVQLVPATVASMVGVDAARDRFFLPPDPDALSALGAPKPSPGAWTVKSLANADAKQLQLEPELGLAALKTLRHEPTQLQYAVTKVEGGIVDIEPPLGAAAQAGDRVTAVKTFRPFGESARDRQEHVVYIGSEALLNIEAAAEIEVHTTEASFADVEWAYWGLTEAGGDPNWQKLTPKPRVTPLTLVKAPGAIEVKAVGGIPSRWLRAIGSAGPEGPLRLGRVSLAVNCLEAPPQCPVPAGQPRSTVPLEAIAGATPVVRGTAFYPLGPEPRQFDAFYLGSGEAFSKTDAEVSICVELLDSSSDGYGAAVIGSTNRPILFAAGRDGNLHRVAAEPGPDGAPLRRLRPVRPPFAEDGNAAGVFAPAPLNVAQPARLTAVTRGVNPYNPADGNDAIVATTAGDQVWLWRQTADPTRSRWYYAGRMFEPPEEPPAVSASDPPGVILARKGTGLRLIGLNDGALYSADLTAGWEEVSAGTEWKKAPAAPGGRSWRMIVPVARVGGRLMGALAEDGVLAVATDDSVFWSADPASANWIDLAIGPVEKDVAPLGLRTSNTELMVVVQGLNEKVLACTLQPATEAVSPQGDIAARAVGSFDWSDEAFATSGPAVVFMKERSEGGRELATWFPMAPAASAADPKTLYVGARLTAQVGTATVSAGAVIAPNGSAILRVEFNPGGLKRTTIPESALEDVVAFDRADPPYAVGDFIVLKRWAMDAVRHQLLDDPELVGTNRFVYRPSPPFTGRLKSAQVHRRRLPDDFLGESQGSGTVLLEAGDHNARVDDLVMVKKQSGTALKLHTVTVVDENPGSPWTINADPQFQHAAGTKLEYWYVEDADDANRVLPLLKLPGLAAETVAAVREGRAYFAGAQPSRQAVLLVRTVGGVDEYAVLDKSWTKVPKADSGGNLALILNELYATVREVPAPVRAVTARLSWEYWDGASWWVIPGLQDGTTHLRNTGVVTFCVPKGLSETDVAGRTNHWIRARLVEGDYGRERVSVKTDPVPGGGTAQTVERSTADIAAPQIVWVDLRYSVCCLSTPDHLITKDGGAFLDRSVANRTPGATVEAFVPLRETIARAARRSTAEGTGETIPALYLGFDAAVRDGPISLLFLVEEGDHDEAFPLEMDALRETGFEPVTGVDDGTRGLNESGVVSFPLSAPPAAIDLFGQSGFWLRLRPNKVFKGTWDPRLRAVYLNATMARAAETQVEELLGSSDGAPKQTVFLARPPVLEKTLRLRIRERLGEEDVETLRRERGRDEVLEGIGGRPGPWVLWQEVVDPLDYPADARVYSLDDASGAIRFGDGLHGRIPPIGTDVILAERYERGGGDAANKVRPWGQVGLVTPVQGVERVVVPDGAAGGSDAQDANTVLRFAPANQLMRDRALTLRDLEMSARQFSPDIAQARALARPAGVRLIVVMRGRDRSPSRAVARELRRHLLARALPSLGEQGALEIAAPRIVPVRVRLLLAIADVEHSGAVEAEADRRLRELLDPAAGGLARTGWRLGAPLQETDIAAQLDGIEHLEGIEEVAVDVMRPDGTLAALPPIVAPDQLVDLATLNVEFLVSAQESVA